MLKKFSQQKNILSDHVNLNKFSIPQRILRNVFLYLDIYTLSKSCFLVSRTFLSLSLYRIQHNSSVDFSSPIKVTFYHDNEHILRKKRIFCPHPSLWNIIFKDEERKLKLCEISLRIFFSIANCRIVNSNYYHENEIEENGIKKLNSWRLGDMLLQLIKPNEHSDPNIPSPFSINEKIFQSFLSHPSSQGFEKMILCWCCWTGKLDIVKKYFETLKSLKEYMKATLLLLGSAGGHFELVKYFLDLDSQYHCDMEQNISLRLSCFLGHLQLVQFFLEKVDLTNDENYTLRAASLHGHSKIVEILLKQPHIDPLDGFSNRPLRNAVRNNHEDVIKIFMNDERFKDVKRTVIQAELEVACQLGQTKKLVELLKNKKADPSNGRNFCIRSACDYGHLEIVQILLKDSRVDPSACRNYSLRFACREGHVEVVKLLLKDPRVDPAAEWNYPIELACFNGHLEVVELLLDDERVNPGANENCSIVFSSKKGFREIVERLLECKKVDASAQENLALENATHNGYFDIIRLLMSQEKVRALVMKDKQFRVLVRAANRERFEIVKYYCSFVGDLATRKKLGEIGVIEKSISLIEKAQVQTCTGEKFVKIRELWDEDVKSRKDYIFDEKQMNRFVGNEHSLNRIRILNVGNKKIYKIFLLL